MPMRTWNWVVVPLLSAATCFGSVSCSKENNIDASQHNTTINNITQVVGPDGAEVVSPDGAAVVVCLARRGGIARSRRRLSPCSSA